MKQHLAQFRFYEELNDFLPAEKQKVTFEYAFSGNPSVKDAIEAIGVPHTEVDLILANDESVDFEYHICDGDRISVYPVFEGMDITNVNRLRPKPLRETRFILDVHLGKLAKLLRMLGFDTLYQNDYDDPEIIDEAIKQKRIILTRDIGMLKNGAVTHGYWIREKDPIEQAREVIRRFDLADQADPFSRCIDCNGFIEQVDKEVVLDRLPKRTAKHYNTFHFCPACEKVYWAGSHFQKMKNKISQILQ